MPKMLDMKTDSQIIDFLGGTSAVAQMFKPPIKPSSVSEWRTVGIPAARRQILELLRPDAFDPATSASAHQEAA